MDEKKKDSEIETHVESFLRTCHNIGAEVYRRIVEGGVVAPILNPLESRLPAPPSISRALKNRQIENMRGSETQTALLLRLPRKSNVILIPTKSGEESANMVQILPVRH